MNQERIGIIGGSYNPVHIAHLVIADRFTEQLSLSTTYFVPAFRSPFKLNDSANDIVAPHDRLAMLRLAIARNPKFRVSSVELDRQGTSYTIDTIAYFKDLHPQAQLYLLIGSDQAAAFTKWHKWQEILASVQLCIARRPHTIPPEMERALSFQLATDISSPIWIDAPIIALSSSEIRSRIAQGQTIHYIVPHEVEQYLDKNKLYR